MTDILRVLVVDDQPPFRRAARAVLHATPGFLSVGEATTGEEAVALAASLEPDLVLIDIHMPGIGGIEASRRIAALPRAPVTVLVSTHAGPADPASCGAAAYLRKEDFGSGALSTLREACVSRATRRGTEAPPSPVD
jgi:CheY-like chemotaxis protein